MPDYIQILRVRPDDGSRDAYRMKEAFVHIYARAASEAEAARIMQEYFDRQEWTILEVRKAGTIDTSLLPNAKEIRERLETLGYCGDIHYGKPPDDIIFSKS
ncbi:MAG: hypothetical protein WAO00_04365 [Chthoniobacterales bacterium]